MLLFLWVQIDLCLSVSLFDVIPSKKNLKILKYWLKYCFHVWIPDQKFKLSTINSVVHYVAHHTPQFLTIIIFQIIL